MPAQQNKVRVDGTVAPCKVIHGDWMNLPADLRVWVKAKIEMCKPKDLHIMDGSVEEDQAIKKELVARKVMKPLKYEDCYLTLTDPKDVARVESKTFISTPEKLETIPPAAEGVKGTLGNWMAPEDLDKKIQELFPGCMKGNNA